MGCGASSAVDERAAAYEAMQMQQRGGGGGGGFPGAAAPAYTVGANQFAVGGAAMGGFPGQGFPGQQHVVMAGGQPNAGGGRGGQSAAPPRRAAPQVGGKTLKLKNHFNLHKQSIKLEPTEEGAKQELHFTFDAEIAGEAQIFWDCVDMTFPEILEDPSQLKKAGLDLQREKADAKPKWFKFPAGSGQEWHGASIRSSKASSAAMRKERRWEHAGKSGSVTPLVVRLRGLVQGEGEQSQTTYAALQKTGPAGRELAARCLRQKVLCHGCIYTTEEVYGASVEDGEEEDPCVVCQTEPRECIILPCRHCCLCYECAKDLTQTGSVQLEYGQVVTGADPKCPMCREDIESVIRKGGKGEKDKSKQSKKQSKKHERTGGSDGSGKAAPAPSGGGELPYGGDMQKATQAQDRDAIRVIMAARQGGGGAGSEGSGGGRGGGTPPPAEQPKGDLPYGGDMQAAMKAQDRDAIRVIMAARDAGKPD